MLFSSGKPGAPLLGLLDAALRGYPEEGGVFAPAGEADLRSLVYGPELSFMDGAALGAAALFPEDIDPLRASALAEAAFAPRPAAYPLGEEILLLDLAAGPTGSAADYAARFALAFLGRRLEGRIGIAALGPREGAALAAAAAASSPLHPALPLALLLPEAAFGRPFPPLERSPGLLLIAVRGGAAELRALERRTAGLSLGERAFLPLGPESPARFAGTLLLLLALFAIGRKDLPGDLLVAAPPGDDEALAAGLWAWSWGLPVSAYLRPEGPLRLERFGTELLDRFPLRGALSSLVLPLTVGAEAARAAELELRAANCPPCGASTAFALAAAHRALEEGYRGHARVLLPRLSDPGRGGAGPGAGGGGLLPDATIGPSLPELEAALSALLSSRSG